ncbi:hypothetical protein WJX84_006058 [Apatococcus fuscideae]|uniref:Uncharacterized protein n=1 Tax=Apatococcus fuscideae TaxID=2026836 RepID=A0AAW1SNC2_9CHLO
MMLNYGRMQLRVFVTRLKASKAASRSGEKPGGRITHCADARSRYNNTFFCWAHSYAFSSCVVSYKIAFPVQASPKRKQPPTPSVSPTASPDASPVPSSDPVPNHFIAIPENERGRAHWLTPRGATFSIAAPSMHVRDAIGTQLLHSDDSELTIVRLPDGELDFPDLLELQLTLRESGTLLDRNGKVAYQPLDLVTPEVYDGTDMPTNMKWWPLQTLPSNMGTLGVFSSSTEFGYWACSDLYLLTNILLDPQEMLTDRGKPRHVTAAISAQEHSHCWVVVAMASLLQAQMASRFPEAHDMQPIQPCLPQYVQDRMQALSAALRFPKRVPGYPRTVGDHEMEAADMHKAQQAVKERHQQLHAGGSGRGEDHQP